MRNFWTYLKTKDFRFHILGAIGTVVAVIFIAYLSLGYYTRHGDGIPVPQLKGLTVERATAMLEEQGFQYKIDSVYVQDQPPGTILEQDPDAGTKVKENRTIYLTMVTTQAPPVNLPDLEQSTYREAVAILSNTGLKVGDTTYRSDIARDRVLEVRFGGQVIKTGQKLPKGSVVDLVLGDGAGANEVDIPDLLNQDLDAARFAIRGAGLSIGNITYEGSITDSTNLVVVRQFPMRTDSTAKTSIGTRVNLTVTQGKSTNEPQPQQQPEQQQP
ncbi:PASTA domain-containing protein [Mucilaginibacter terrae]|uniref:Beta-lactam-binding protein with PASTA domain n=1 Tax=Mucilaginibacter terrae TaxID=1955052 RepID=A0ABU3H3C1_9SPHI|nr:PASTA domain-containing protein [Mucilaginibacter terrae]MDT3405410.1 beta-lactam-binding protein with PASTA domain [Mucilaginibacter terrae]